MENDFINLIGTVIVAALIAFLWYSVGETNGYKQGQIDALNGIIKYELIVNKDKTITWENKNAKQD